MDFAIRRQSGYRDALTARGIAFDAKLGGEWRNDRDIWLCCGHADAEIRYSADCASRVVDHSAIGVRRALYDLGLKMGRDVSVVIHDDDLSYFRNNGDVPIFTGARSSVREAGRRCAHMLLDAIDRPEQDPSHVLLEAELTIGLSTGPVPAVVEASDMQRV